MQPEAEHGSRKVSAGPNMDVRPVGGFESAGRAMANEEHAIEGAHLVETRDVRVQHFLIGSGLDLDRRPLPGRGLLERQVHRLLSSAHGGGPAPLRRRA